MATPTNLPAAQTTGAVLTAAYMNDLRGAFRILQVVQASYSIIVASTTTTYVNTGLTATITPQSANSKIFVMFTQSLYADTAVAEMGFALIRGATTLDAQLAPVFSSGGAIVGQGVYNYLDSPSTTSATTYKTMISKQTGSGTIYANINSNTARITLFEVSA